jgi:hypothetical protein
MLKSSVPEPQYLAPKSNCEVAPEQGFERDDTDSQTPEGNLI